MIYNCAIEMAKYHNEKVRLSKDEQDKLKDYREKNLTRLKNGLEKDDKSMYKKAINQGSYAMHTINQDKENDYDIDVGIIFDKEDLVGSQGADMSALDARKMVCEAMQDENFKNQPKVMKNCVRVYYEEGHHVDMPVYKQCKDEDDNITQELASSDWKESDPEAITEWFNSVVIDKSSDTANGCQMRRVTRFIKKWAKSRNSWNMPSGFIVSVLVDECYLSKAGRDDESLYDVLKAIRNRLSWNKNVYNPVNNNLISEGKESQLQKMYDELNKALFETLNILENTDCTHEDAMKAWSKFFYDDFFKEQIKKENKSKCSYESIGVTIQPWQSN